MKTGIGGDSSSGSNSAADDLDEAIECAREIKTRATRESADYSITLSLRPASRVGTQCAVIRPTMPKRSSFCKAASSTSGGAGALLYSLLSIGACDRTPFMGPPVVRVGDCVGLAS